MYLLSKPCSSSDVSDVDLPKPTGHHCFSSFWFDSIDLSHLHIFDDCLLITLAAKNLEKASVPLAQLKLFSSPQRQPPMVLTKYTT
jgi:hypothetical protein